jgi:hypothetical protein
MEAKLSPALLLLLRRGCKGLGWTAMQADHDIKILKKHYLEVVTKDLRLGATADCYRLARIWQARLMARFESNVAISAGSGGRCS